MAVVALTGTTLIFRPKFIRRGGIIRPTRAAREHFRFADLFGISLVVSGYELVGVVHAGAVDCEPVDHS